MLSWYQRSFTTQSENLNIEEICSSFSPLVARVLGLLVPLLELAVERLGEVRHVVDDDDVVLDLEGDLLVAPLDEVLEQVLGGHLQARGDHGELDLGGDLHDLSELLQQLLGPLFLGRGRDLGVHLGRGLGLGFQLWRCS